MKTRQFLAGLVAVAVVAGTSAFVGPVKKAATYKVDTQKSVLNWEGKKVTGQHNGAVKFNGGSLIVDGSKLTGGTFEFDMNSITCADLTDAGYNAKFIGHMKSEDFFNTAKFPTSKFVITKVTPKGGNKFDITGNMTIKNITNPVTFPATVTMNGNSISAEGKATLDRTKYDIRYGSKSFFENIGDKAIYDDFAVEIKMVASK
ncbi:YceI family protein [Rudanella paleaurantiibacter]|uniref:YceI family protein n=1 Tax=Rudanella paleaurantiibacter TaxID=2614655 RepID=A0A7J5TYN2_9BACT|nr:MULTISPECIES: YceI family protein [Rudanella]KAB7730256.1 YceI family protein [Rudanella paleaurantiibacter]